MRGTCVSCRLAVPVASPPPPPESSPGEEAAARKPMRRHGTPPPVWCGSKDTDVSISVDTDPCRPWKKIVVLPVDVSSA